MKRLLSAASLSFAIVACTTNCVFASDPPTSTEQLRSEFETALKSKNTNTVFSLFNQEGFSDRDSVGWWIAGEESEALLGTNITNVKLSPLPTNFQQTLDGPTNKDGLGDTWEGDNGHRARFNLTVLGILDVKSQAGDLAQLPYGKKGDAYYIAGVTNYLASGKSLYARVTGGGIWANAEHHAASLTYTGSWIYVKDGREIKVDINEHTNQFRECWGDYIKSFNVRQTSTDTMIMVDLHEDGKTIFDSGRVDTGEPIVFERK
jgi:hypothetical protein